MSSSEFESKLQNVSKKYKKIHLMTPTKNGYLLPSLSKKGFDSTKYWDGVQLVGEGEDLYWSQITAILGVDIDRKHPEKYLVFVVPERINSSSVADQEGHIISLFESGKFLVAKEITTTYGWYKSIKDTHNSLFFPYHVWVLGDRKVQVYSDKFYLDNPHNVPVRNSRGYEVIGGKREEYPD
jgi:hypothetical protein